MMNADRNPNDLVVNLDKYNNIDLVTSSAASSAEAAVSNDYSLEFLMVVDCVK